MTHAIQSETFLTITINGKQIPFITDAVITMWVVMAIIIALVLILTAKIQVVPGRRQAVAEIMVEFFRNFAHEQIGEHGAAYAPYIGTLLLFLAVSNIISIFDIVPIYSLHPPTRNFNVTLCLAVISIVLVIYAEFKHKGVRRWLQSFYKPTPISAFIKILDYVVRPMSLCLRLFGNMLGGVIVMTLLYQAMPLFVPAAAGIYFDLFDGGLQAYVFTFLTSIYLAEATETEPA